MIIIITPPKVINEIPIILPNILLDKIMRMCWNRKEFTQTNQDLCLVCWRWFDLGSQLISDSYIHRVSSASPLQLFFHIDPNRRKFQLIRYLRNLISEEIPHGDIVSGLSLLPSPTNQLLQTLHLSYSHLESWQLNWSRYYHDNMPAVIKSIHQMASLNTTNRGILKLGIRSNSFFSSPPVTLILNGLSSMTRNLTELDVSCYLPPSSSSSSPSSSSLDSSQLGDDEYQSNQQISSRNINSSNNSNSSLIDFSQLSEFIMERSYTLIKLILNLVGENNSHLIHFYEDILSCKPLISGLEHLCLMVVENRDYPFPWHLLNKFTNLHTLYLNWNNQCHFLGGKGKLSLSQELITYLSNNNTITHLGSHIPISSQVVQSGLLSKSNIKTLSISINDFSFDNDDYINNSNNDNNNNNNNNIYSDDEEEGYNNTKYYDKVNTTPILFNSTIKRLSVRFDLTLPSTNSMSSPPISPSLLSISPPFSSLVTPLHSNSSSNDPFDTKVNSNFKSLELVLDPFRQSNWIHGMRNLTHLELQYPPAIILGDLISILTRQHIKLKRLNIDFRFNKCSQLMFADYGHFSQLPDGRSDCALDIVHKELLETLFYAITSNPYLSKLSISNLPNVFTSIFFDIIAKNQGTLLKIYTTNVNLRPMPNKFKNLYNCIELDDYKSIFVRNL